MKTPREFLLSKHTAAEPKLDAITEGVLSRLAEKDEASSSALIDRIRRLFPLPRFGWSTIGAAWLAIIVLNMASRESSPAPVIAKARPETIEILREQKQLFAELIGNGMAADAEPSRSAPRPHSARRPDFAFA